MLNTDWGSVGDSELVDYMSNQGYEENENESQGFDISCMGGDWSDDEDSLMETQPFNQINKENVSP